MVALLKHLCNIQSVLYKTSIDLRNQKNNLVIFRGDN